MGALICYYISICSVPGYCVLNAQTLEREKLYQQREEDD